MVYMAMQPNTLQSMNKEGIVSHEEVSESFERDPKVLKKEL